MTERDPAGPPAERAQSTPPTAVWALLLLHVSLMVLYSVLAPTFRAPDEYVHVDLARHVAGGDAYPRYDERYVAAAIFRARDTSPAYLSYAPAVSADAAVPRAQRPSFDELGPDEPTDIVNPIAQHPPLYYGLAGGVLVALDGVADASTWPFDRQVAALRLFDVLLVAPLPLLAWATARRLLGSPVAAVAAAALVVCIPSLTHIGSVVNNDNLLALLGAVLALVVVRIVTGDTGVGTSLLGGLVLGLALLTKGFALVLGPWLVVAYAVALVPAGRWWALAGRVVTATGVAFAVGGWWWARNLIVDGRLLPAVGLRDRVPVDPDVSEFASGFLDRLLSGVWGSFGWREAELPFAAVSVLSLGVVLVVARTVVRSPLRVRLAVLLVPAAVLALLITANAWRAYLKTGVPWATQGRYLFAGLLGVVVVVAASVPGLDARWRRRVPLGLLVLAVLLHGAAVDTITGRFWDGGRIGALTAFAPWPPGVVAAMATAVVLAVATTARALRPSAMAAHDGATWPADQWTGTSPPARPARADPPVPRVDEHATR